MSVIEDPNCDKQIPVPDDQPSEIICPDSEEAIEPKCSDTVSSDLAESDDSPEESVEPTPHGWAGFKLKHPKIAKGIKLGTGVVILIAGAVGAGLLLKDKLDTFYEPPESDSDNNDSYSSMVSRPIYTSSTVEQNRSVVNPENYDSVLRQHDLSIRNMDERHYPSAEKLKQANDLGIKLDTHQTIVNSFPQHHRVKKDD